MSSIFSDPFFRRGSTLLGGEAIEYSDEAQTLPVAGNEIEGQVKAFQDVRPTGDGKRFSNRLVYCVAARYIGNDTDGATLAGKLVSFSTTAPLARIGVSGSAASAALADATAIAAGRSYGVVDEYIPATTAFKIRKNDIVWVVVKGPTEITKLTSGTASAATVAAGEGVAVSTTAGAVNKVTGSGGTAVAIGENITGASVGDAVASIRVNLHTDVI